MEHKEMNGTFIYNGKTYHREMLYRGEEARYYGTNMRGEGIAITLDSDKQDIPDAFMAEEKDLELIECKKLEA